jgi:hypothetical protein
MGCKGFELKAAGLPVRQNTIKGSRMALFYNLTPSKYLSIRRKIICSVGEAPLL